LTLPFLVSSQLISTCAMLGEVGLSLGFGFELGFCSVLPLPGRSRKI
jgi:hypothetical protein